MKKGHDEVNTRTRETATKHTPTNINHAVPEVRAGEFPEASS